MIVVTGVKMKPLLKLLILSIFVLPFTSCQSTDGLATSILYPVDTVNKTKIPAVPTDGFQSVMLTNGQNKIANWVYHDTSRPDAPVIIYFHGNGENIGDLSAVQFLTKMRTFNVSLVVTDFPQFGLSTGALTEQSLVDAGDAVFAWTKTAFPNSPIIVWGRSLGAAVAVQVASHHQADVEKLVLTHPWTSLHDLVQQLYPSLVNSISATWYGANTYDTVSVVKHLKMPTMIHHGTVDTTVPFAMGQTVANTFPPGVATFHPVPGKSHNDIFEAQSIWDDIDNFVNH
jgi:uncharacterized protein